MAPPAAEGTLTINEGSGPFHYGDTLTFTTESDNLRGGHEMVEVALFQDADADGDVEPGLFNGDLVSVALNKPEYAFPLPYPPEGGATDTSKPAKGWARLLNYNWKGRQQYIDELDRVEFDVVP